MKNLKKQKNPIQIEQNKLIQEIILAVQKRPCASFFLIFKMKNQKTSNQAIKYFVRIVNCINLKYFYKKKNAITKRACS